jgi:hypothetical protein
VVLPDLDFYPPEEEGTIPEEEGNISDQNLGTIDLTSHAFPIFIVSYQIKKLLYIS